MSCTRSLVADSSSMSHTKSLVADSRTVGHCSIRSGTSSTVAPSSIRSRTRSRSPGWNGSDISRRHAHETVCDTELALMTTLSQTGSLDDLTSVNLPRQKGQPSADEITFGPDGYDFTSPDPLPMAGRRRVMELLESGRLFRYGGTDDVAELERLFAKYVGTPYAMACNSCGCGLFLALKGLGVKPGEKVLVNSWTLAPVPGAIVHANAVPIFVKTDASGLCIDLEDLERKALESGAKYLLLSYMRGHVPDMDRLLAVVRRLGLELIEDCAHTLGAKWKLDNEQEYRHLGTFGSVGVWSLQTNKSINSGEGGLIATNRQDIASVITISTGSYGHFALNGASGDIAHLSEIYPTVPNMSMRMTCTAAALATPQLDILAHKVRSWARHAVILRKALLECPHISTPKQRASTKGKKILVYSSIQFELVDFSADMVEEVLCSLSKVGIPLAWFGGQWRGFTSTLKDWKFADPTGEDWKPTISHFIGSLVDLPLYHTTSWPDSVFEKLGRLIVDAVTEVASKRRSSGTSKEQQISKTE
eukprot:TRINITY_DN60222_c0_g1_i1.p1 TRINITY_DN60222_c0_g1~~TRINITY_DN60222_c0_g1_i1.p1  ORF type:complete len:533 (-),score=56.45 TRINITY_DN60222_c0_g1_i1:46-1644(-)